MVAEEPVPSPAPRSLRVEILARLVGIPIALLWKSLRVERINYERYRALTASGVPVVLPLWHGRMLLPILGHVREGVVTMASQSKDGEIVARWLERHGYVVVRGSSTRGGGPAFREAVRLVRSGRNMAITVDGPQGPPRVVQPGILALARLTDAVVMPAAFACSRPRFLRSWDRYLLPMPFSRAVMVYGEDFRIPQAMSDEEALRRIAEATDAATRTADQAVGISPPPPWA